MTSEGKKYLTIRDVAEKLKHLDITERTIYRYVKDGRIKAIKIGGFGGWRIEPKDLEAFLKQTSKAKK